MITPVVLSGGSGTRLWPRSVPSNPKQFLPLLGDRTLFQETLLRLRGLPNLGDPIVVCNEAHRYLVAEQLRQIDMPANAIVLEPVARNTAPAIAAAAGVARQLSHGSDQDPTLLVLPADHVVADADAFRAAVLVAANAAECGNLVTFGVVPTHPETGYGYIERGGDEGGYSAVKRFVEKPDLSTAEKYLKSGRFLWNSGMFVFRAGAFLDEVRRLTPAIAAASDAAVAAAESDGDFTRLGDAFKENPSDSIDYAIMERTDRASVVALDAGWSDVGSWAALKDVITADATANAQRGDVIAIDCAGTYISAENRLVAAIGLENVVIVETEDAVLVIDAAQSQRVKEIVDQVKARKQ